MSVVTEVSSDLTRASGRETCSLCDGYLHYPFLYWRGQRELFICSCCCVGQGNGLRADLLQVEAIAELQRLYPEFTLERKRQTWRQGYAPCDPESLPDFANDTV